MHGSIFIDEKIAKSYTKSIYDRHEGDYAIAWNHIAAHYTKKTVVKKLPPDFVLINGTKDVLSPVNEIDRFKNRFIVKYLNGAGHLFFNRHVFAELLQFIIAQIKE